MHMRMQSPPILARGRQSPQAVTPDRVARRMCSGRRLESKSFSLLSATISSLPSTRKGLTGLARMQCKRLAADISVLSSSGGKLHSRGPLKLVISMAGNMLVSSSLGSSYMGHIPGQRFLKWKQRPIRVRKEVPSAPLSVSGVFKPSKLPPLFLARFTDMLNPQPVAHQL
ncbi:hypothetical protein BDV98DRAFT_601046 [Pterulicium gracile]|uniref:Uncharacterized protein n=1 Tax=Pterulicium gracile TaxID=1884261 RepID=A0A5C3QWE7_9AGAR|nr:hypothetical protein BDV98DRAFT_601046 [Pterula gracilis]